MSDGVPQLLPWTELVGAAGDEARALTAALASADDAAERDGGWPEALWALLIDAGATRWSLPAEFGGRDCPRPELIERFARVAEGSLTAAFVLSQHEAGVRRLLNAAHSGHAGAARWVEKIAAGTAFTTVGISQLSTSRRHGARALKAAETAPGRYTLDGVMPWVTAASRADVIVTGAVLDDGRQLLLAVPSDRPGLDVQPPFELAALGPSCTAEVRCEGVEVDGADILAGPAPEVMSGPSSVGTGGLETSALALGQARAALAALVADADRRDELAASASALADSWAELRDLLMDGARNAPEALSAGAIRARANALVLRATQSYLVARKGTGFLRSEPAQRWARQALFFLVWSCPGPVAQAALRDLAGLCED